MTAYPSHLNEPVFRNSYVVVGFICFMTKLIHAQPIIEVCGVQSGDGGIAYEVNTHAALSHVALTNDLSQLHYVLQEEWLLADGIFELATDSATGDTLYLLEWVEYGSIHEDDGDRPLNHFHDPISDEGYSGFIDGHDAIYWAIDALGENPYNIRIGANELWLSLIQAQPAWRSHSSHAAFRRVGHFMHMIQDLAQPAHTRNDDHLFDAWLEYYAQAVYGSPESLNGLEKIQATGSSPDDLPYFILTEPLPGHQTYRHFLDTDQYTGQIGFAGFGQPPNNGLPPGMSEYSNYGFFSEDTIFTDYQHPLEFDTDFFQVFPVTNWVVSYVDQISPLVAPMYIRKPGSLPGIDTGYRLCAGQNQGYNVIREFWYGDAPIRIVFAQDHVPVLDDYCELLLPKAIAYCTDFANFFFRGRLHASIEGNCETGELELFIMNLSGDTLTSGQWMLLQDDDAGARQQVGADFSTYPGSLAHGQAFVTTFEPTGRAGQYVLVFKANGAPTDPFTFEVVAKAFAEPSGACCTSEGCVIVVQPECVALNGIFQGSNSECPPGECACVVFEPCDDSWPQFLTVTWPSLALVDENDDPICCTWDFSNLTVTVELQNPGSPFPYYLGTGTTTADLIINGSPYCGADPYCADWSEYNVSASVTWGSAGWGVSTSIEAVDSGCEGSGACWGLWCETCGSNGACTVTPGGG